MRSTIIAICCLLVVAGSAFAQGGRGTITGTVADPAGAVIPSAPIELKNINTGAVYQTESSTTGNYTFGQLPAGKYQISSSVPGFKQFSQTGITVMAAQTLRIDFTLEVGDISETVTVSADAPLLRTESGELASNIAGNTLSNLPLLGFSAFIRDPYKVTELIPGTYFSNTGARSVRVNGAPANTQSTLIEGQDATNGLWQSWSTYNQQSVDAIEEFAIQTSNYAAEYGQTGGGLYNVTMKSGTNQLHGSVYDYWVNEAWNAYAPIGDPDTGVKERDRQRRHNYGFTVGGPVYIPKVYDGRDKLFFFFNFEQFRDTKIDNTTRYTVPTTLMRQGNFSEILTGEFIRIDDLGNDVYENMIYDPLTTDANNMRTQFPGNIIPADRLNPVALKIQDMLPPPSGPYKDDLTSNYQVPFTIYNYRTIPSLKVDYNLSSRSKLSGYWSMTRIDANYIACDGFYDVGPFSGCTLTYDRTQTVRINYDFTLAPTKLLHFGAGLQKIRFTNDTQYPNFDQQAELGIPQPAGADADIFPRITGLGTSYGGYGLTMGPSNQNRRLQMKPTANASLTWVKSNHTYKFGAEMRIEGFQSKLLSPAYGFYGISSSQTAIPIPNYVTGAQSIGFPYASFLLGQFDSVTIGAAATPRIGKSAWAVYAQDSWKVTRKFTLDYGLRWDYQGYLNESYGRMGSFSPTTPNPRVDNLPGAMVFERNGVKFSSVYPYAFGPRLGAAYQITPKTVLRAGWGISYGQTASENGVMSLSGSTSVSYSAPSYGKTWRTLDQGAPESPDGVYTWPDLDPGQKNISPVPVRSTPFTASATELDSGAGRPPRQIQWSIGIQQEITQDLMVEASYVGNRGAWWECDTLLAQNAISADRLASFGLSLDNEDDRALLRGRLSSPAAADRINPVTGLPFSTPPYTGFPTSQTVAQSLRPFPHFTNIRNKWAPLGRTWYDSLQVKVTKRFSHGLDFTSSFTWAKELVLGSETSGGFTSGGLVNDAFNRSLNKYLSTYSRPVVWITALNYTLPRLDTNRMLSWAIRDWTIGAVFEYASGRPIAVPGASSSTITSAYTFQSTFANRVEGEPLYARTVRNADGTTTTTPLDSLNDRSSYDPLTDFVLNPAAWEDPPAGQYSTSAAYFSDYRYPRQPSERLSIGRIFRLKEGISLSIRADFDNIFNRFTLTSNLFTSTNATSTQRWESSGRTSSGFGRVNAAAAAGQRSGVIVARLRF